MADVVVEYKGGVVEEVTILGQPARVFVLDWDEGEEQGSGAECVPWPAHQGAGSLASETRALYEKATCER